MIALHTIASLWVKGFVYLFLAQMMLNISIKKDQSS